MAAIWKNRSVKSFLGPQDVALRWFGDDGSDKNKDENTTRVEELIGTRGGENMKHLRLRGTESECDQLESWLRNNKNVVESLKIDNNSSSVKTSLVKCALKNQKTLNHLAVVTITPLALPNPLESFNSWITPHENIRTLALPLVGWSALSDVSQYFPNLEVVLLLLINATYLTVL